MVPFTVYLLQRVLKVWPRKDPGAFTGFTKWVRPGWVVMEIATVTVGVAFLVWVRFPFLLFPTCFSMWYLSMDLAPLYPGFNRMSHVESTAIRSRVSIAMGVVMAALGRLAETWLGSDPDFGFWLYLFGLLTFWLALNVDYPSSDLQGSLYLLANLALALLGSHLDRTTFRVFATLGVLEYLITLVTGVVRTHDSALLWLLKALVASALLSQAVRRDGNFEIAGAIVCVLAFNFNYLQYVTSHEVYAVLLLLTDLGFVATAGAFNRPLDLWFAVAPSAQQFVAFVFSLTVLAYHAKLFKYIGPRPPTLATSLFLAYRLLASVGVALAFVCLRQPHFSLVGGVGVPLVSYCLASHRSAPLTLPFLGHLFGVWFSLFLESNLLYLVCCLALLAFMLHMLSGRDPGSKVQGSVFAVFLVLLSIPLNSKFVIVIGAFYLISYFTHLTYTTFKNSLTFPLVLILLGTAVIGGAIQYQRYEPVLQETYQSLLPDVLRTLLSTNVGLLWHEGAAFDWASLVSESNFMLEGLAASPARWLLWSGAVTFALVRGSSPYVVYVCGGSAVVLVAMVLLARLCTRMEKHLDGKVKVSGHLRSVLRQKRTLAEENSVSSSVRLWGQSPQTHGRATQRPLPLKGGLD